MREFKPHQHEATAVIRRLMGCAGLFMAPGTMKTLVAVRYAEQAWTKLLILRRDDFMTWHDELAQEGVPLHKIVEITSGDKRTIKKAMLAMAFGGCWVMVTYDLVKNPTVYEFIKSIAWDLCIADEAHMIKRWSSDRTKKVIRSTRHIPRRLALTGSAITNKPIDVFSQCLFIDNGKTFGDNEWKFKRRYYLPQGHQWYLKRGAKEQISAKLKQVSYYVHEDDVLKLPKKRYVIKSAPLSGIQQRHYETVLKEWELQIASGQVIEIDQVIVQLAKLKQIASGFFYVDGVPQYLRCPKLELMRDMLTDEEYAGLKPKVVIWCSHTAEIMRVAMMAKNEGWGHVTFSGSNRKRKEAARKQFRDDPATRLFIGQVDSGVGMNELIGADTAMYYSNSFKVVSRQQSERRVRRHGSEHHQSITYWDFFSEGTVDKRIHASVKSSMEVASYILDEIKRGRTIRTILS